mgnify:CR=1 FL=1
MADSRANGGQKLALIKIDAAEIETAARKKREENERSEFVIETK